MKKILLALKNVSVGYGKKIVVNDISMSIKQGKFIALVGLNGCGKTTLLRGILGNATVSGDILIQDKDLKKMSINEKAKEIAYISQHNNITFSIDVWDVLLMGFNPYVSFWNKPNASMRKKAHDIMKAFNLEEYLHEDFLSLSGGQKQLVIFARAILQDSKIWLLDEPDSAMDFTNRHHVLNLVRETLKSSEKSALITIHDPNFALKYCDEIYFMSDGKLSDHVIVDEIAIDKLTAILNKVYGNIDVLEYEGRFVMVKK
ncbi:MAG: ABC transporter ATP-binding protein [Anaerorhabdus sp.]